MGILSKIGNAVKNAYNKVDSKVGGYLPGGQTPQQVSQSKSSSPSSSSPASSAPQQKSSPSPTNSTITSSRSGGSSGGVSINLPANLTQQSSTPLPYQTRGTATDLAPKVPDSVKSVNVSATYGGSGGSSPPASAPATGASGSALNQGGGPASPGSSGGSSGAVVSAATGPMLDKPYDVRDSMSFGDKYASVDKNFFGGLLPGGTKLSSESFSAGLENVRDAAQQAFGAGPYQSPKPITAFGKFIDPFDVFGSTKTKGDVRTPDISPGGTGIYNPQTGQYDPWVTQRGGTGYDKIKEQAFLNPDLAKQPAQLATETARNVLGELQPQFQSRAGEIQAGYQAKINAGQLTVEQATPLYNADIASLQSQFQSQAQDIYTSRLGPKIAASQAFSKQFADYNKALYPKISSIGTGAVLVAGGFAGGSSVAAVRAVSGVVNAAVAVEGGSNFYEGVANKNYLQAGLGLAAFGLGTYGALRYAANEVTIAQIEGATQQAPVRVGVYRSQFNQQENMFIDRAYYKQATSSAQAYTTTETISRFNPQTRTFDVISGSSSTVGRTTDFWTGRPFAFGSYSTYSGVGTAIPEGTLFARAPGAVADVAFEGFTPSVTKLQITNQYSYSAFGSFDNTVLRYSGATSTKLFGALVGNNPQSGQLQFVSGQLNPVEQVVGKGFVATKTPFTFNVQAFGNINEISPGSGGVIDFRPFPSSGLRGNIPSLGSGSGALSQSFAGGGLFEVPASLTESFAAPANSLTQAAAFQTGAQGIAQSGRGFASYGAAAASLWAGTGQYERTENYQIFAPALTQNALQSQIAPPIIDVIPTVRTGGQQIPFLAPGLGQSPALDQPQIPLLQQPFPFDGIVPGTPTRFNPQFDPDLTFGLPGLKGFDAGELGKSPIPGGKQRLKYVPDFEALVFGIKGKAPKGGAAPNPFAARPITKGFSFAFEEGPDFGTMFKDLAKAPGLRQRRRR